MVLKNVITFRKLQPSSIQVDIHDIYFNVESPNLLQIFL